MCKRLPDDYCRWCGDLIDRERCGSDSRFYCDRICYWAAIRAGEQPFKGKLRGPWDQITEWAFSNLGINQPKKRRSTYKPRPPCLVCGVETNHRHAKFCGPRCKKKWRGVRQCACGTLVENATAYGRAMCLECKRQSLRAQRQMRKTVRKRCKGVFNPHVKPQRVFVRDDWTCHLCGTKCDRVFHVLNPKSATIDHWPIPLSKNGDHDWHNVKTACLRCNTRQGNRTGFALDRNGRVVAATG